MNKNNIRSCWTILCIKCKGLLDPDDKFCVNCGTKVNISILIDKEDELLTITDKLDFQFKRIFYSSILTSGLFQSELVTVLPSGTIEKIDAYAQIEQQKGFLTILERENSFKNQNEPFYLITDKNFYNLLTDIPYKSKKPIDTEVYQRFLYYKNNINVSFLEEISLFVGNDHNVNKMHRKMLEINSSYLLINILKTNPMIMNDQILHKFITDTIVAVLTYDKFIDAFSRSGYYFNWF